ncbi:MAG: rod shape-determining protein [Nitrospirota bacterium]
MIAIVRRSFWRTDIAIDLGTAVTRVALGESAPLVRPSLADGTQALRSGVVADPDATVAVLRPLIRAATKFGIIRPKALVCVPTDVNEQEREAVVDCLIRAGASTTVVVPEPLAAAIGSGVDMLSPYAHMILDIGEGVTDCAIIKEGAIIASRAVRVGCCELREAVKKGVMEKWSISVTHDAAEYGMRNFDISYPYRDKEYGLFV